MMPAMNMLRGYAEPNGIVTDPVSYVGAGSFAYGSTSVAPAYPSSLAANDAIFCIIGSKPDTAAPQAASGWTQVASIAGGGGTTGADTGPTIIRVYQKDSVSGSESGTVTFSITSGNSSWGIMLAYRKAVGYSWSIAAATGTDSTTGTTWSVTCSTNPGLDNKDFVFVAGCTPTDVAAGAQFSSHAITATGATIGSVTEVAEASSATGNDIGGYVARGVVTAGPSSAAPVITATAGGTTTNVRGPGVIVRVRAVAPSPPVDFNPANRSLIGWWKAASGNVTLSGSDVTNWDDLASGDNDGVTPGFGGNPLFVSSDATINNHAAIEFDQAGGGGNGEALDADGVAPLVTGPFTVSCTAKVTSLTTFCALWSLHDPTGGAYVYNGTENSAIIHVTSEDDTVGNGGTGNFASGAFTGIDSNWHVYTTVVTPRVGATAGSFAFYIDGQLKTMTDNTVESRLSFTAFKIAMSDGYALAGRIAEIAVYNEAFDATTVRNDALFMAADKGITIP